MAMETSGVGSSETVGGVGQEGAVRAEGAECILVVDDDEDGRIALRVLLESYGHIVYEAEDGKEAIREARRRAPRLILMDLMMPVMDGIEAARRIREISGQGDPRIICVSAMEGAREAAAAAGFDDCMLKPLDLARFRQRIDAWLAAS